MKKEKLHYLLENTPCSLYLTLEILFVTINEDVVGAAAIG